MGAGRRETVVCFYTAMARAQRAATLLDACRIMGVDLDHAPRRCPAAFAALCRYVDAYLPLHGARPQ